MKPVTYILTKDTLFGKKGERFETDNIGYVNYTGPSSTYLSTITPHEIQLLLDAGTFEVEEEAEAKASEVRELFKREV